MSLEMSVRGHSPIITFISVVTILVYSGSVCIGFAFFSCCGKENKTKLNANGKFISASQFKSRYHIAAENVVFVCVCANVFTN